MNRIEVREQYFDWLYTLICGDDTSYTTLFSALYDTKFVWVLPMDENRAIHGKDFRYEFGFQNNIPAEVIDICFRGKSCNVLEMMCEMCWSCEKDIMFDPSVGDRTGKWFWDMLTSLGVSHMDNDHFDQKMFDLSMDIFLHRRYDYNGEGGLITIDGIDTDMRTVDIWTQMMWYLTRFWGY